MLQYPFLEDLSFDFLIQVNVLIYLFLNINLKLLFPVSKCTYLVHLHYSVLKLYFLLRGYYFIFQVHSLFLILLQRSHPKNLSNHYFLLFFFQNYCSLNKLPVQFISTLIIPNCFNILFLMLCIFYLIQLYYFLNLKPQFYIFQGLVKLKEKFLQFSLFLLS